MNQGLGKLLDATKAVELLKEDLAQMEKSLQAANIKSEKVLIEVIPIIGFLLSYKD